MKKLNIFGSEFIYRDTKTNPFCWYIVAGINVLPVNSLTVSIKKIINERQQNNEKKNNVFLAVGVFL